jgi:hypothetical protein
MSEPVRQERASEPPPGVLPRLYYRLSEFRMYRGVRVAAAPGCASKEVVFGKIFCALDVLGAVAPRQLGRVPTLFYQIDVARLPAALGLWQRRLRTAFLDEQFVLAADTTPEAIASVIIHELTHARLDRAGFQAVHAYHLRCERICFLAERNFVARLAPTAERRRLQRINASYLKAWPEYYTDAASAARVAKWRAAQPLKDRVAGKVIGFIVSAHRAARLNAG